MLATKDFLVIDTEGRNELSEIAIIDEHGQLIYKADNADHPDKQDLRLFHRPLVQIIQDFQTLVQGKTLVFHSDTHDLNVLKKSFRKAGVLWPTHNLKHHCTYKLSRQFFPTLDGYSLEYLSKRLNLRVSGQHFNPMMAHSARYDAQFTYQLYTKIMSQASLQNRIKNLPNPFSSSRVDTPFQTHPDLREICKNQFRTLVSSLKDINTDKNHQSIGVVITGEPGSGKTHLMMRLAQTTLKTNRLLFIRQPNNANTVLFHIYSRILESLVEPVPDSHYNQLEYLIANSIVQYLKERKIVERKILEKCLDNPLNLFRAMGRKGSDTYRNNWDWIIKRMRPWWDKKYSAAAYSWQILTGLFYYCRYKDEKIRAIIIRWLAGNSLSEEALETLPLEPWDEDLSREAFSLEAMAVLGKLSLLDEPLIIVFDQLEGLGRKQNRVLLENFGEAVKEIFTHVPNSLIVFNLFPDRWNQMKDEVFDGAIVDRMSQYIIQLERPNDVELQAILQAKIDPNNLQLNELFSGRELDDILAKPSIRSVINRAAAYYRFKSNSVPLPSASMSVRSTAAKTANEPQVSQSRLDRLEEDVRILKLQLTALISRQPLDFSDNERSLDADILSIENNIQKQEQRADPDKDLLMDYLDQQRKEVTANYSKPQNIDDSDDIGKLFTILEEVQAFERFDVLPLKLGKKTLPEHVLIQNASRGNVLGFLHIAGSAFTARIKNFNQLVINHKQFHFTLMRDSREPGIKRGTVGRREIEKLNHSENGNFAILNQKDRVELEVLYNLVVDIQNRDLEISVEKAISLILKHQPKHWLLQKLLLKDE